MSRAVNQGIFPLGPPRTITEPVLFLLGAIVLLLAGVQPICASQKQEVFRLQFLGDAYLPPDLEFENTRVGGLSGLTWNEATGDFYAISDDPGSRGPARFYRLNFDFAGGRLEHDGVAVRGVSILKDQSGRPYPDATVDPEGIVLMPGVGVFVSSEGQIKLGRPPSIHLFDTEGNHLRDFDIPDRYFTAGHSEWGVRHNRAFESLTLTPDGELLITATENALMQDGPAAALNESSPARILILDRVTGEVAAEHVYWTDPVTVASPVEGGSEKAGLVDLLAFDRHRLIAVERSYSEGWGNSIRLYLVDLEGAEDLSSVDRGGTGRIEAAKPATKTLLLDFSDLGVELENIEGLTFGPLLQDGRRSLILVADDNFNPDQQRTQFLAFAVSGERPTVAAVQGAAHRSPIEGQWIRGLEGRVTAVSGGDGFWIESLAADDDANTSEGLRIQGADKGHPVSVGDLVVVSGRVVETGGAEDLTVTTLEMSSLEPVDDERRASVAEGEDRGTTPHAPTEVIDNDGLRYFDAEFDGLDYWESLEGMQLVVEEPLVVGPTSQYEELVVVAEGGHRATSRTARGGMLLQPGDPNPERVTLSFEGGSAVPQAGVGDRFEGEVKGIVDYKHGGYLLRVFAPTPPLTRYSLVVDPTILEPRKKWLTMATLNVFNLGPQSDETRVQALAETIVDKLRSPDILAIQEVQDNSGTVDDGTVAADRTIANLVSAIEQAGGPRYDFRQRDPTDGAEGGSPGANIRVAFLFNDERVEIIDRGDGGPMVTVAIVSTPTGVSIDPNPGRLDPNQAAFRGIPGRFGGSRSALVAEFSFRGRSLFLINCHLASKRSDSALFGRQQPPERLSEDQRSQQAQVIRDFVAAILDADPKAAIAVVGDFNESEFRAPLRILTGAGLINLVERVPLEQRYTYNYRGNSQALDHILLSPWLASRSEVEIIHVHADFPHSNAGSDHDPVVARIDFSGAR